MNILSNRQKRGFTIVELVIVIVVMGILATLGIVGYGSIKANAKEKSVLSDSSIAETEVSRYGTKNNGDYTNAAWFSGGGTASAASFTPSEGTVIDVVTTATTYCIRAYNPQATTAKTLANAKTIESTSGACSSLPASDAAIIASGGTIPFTWKDIAQGATAACGIGSNGSVYCWGSNSTGAFGNGNTTSSNIPTAMTMSGTLAGKVPKSIIMGSSTACVLTTDNGTYCSGNNSSYGEFGLGTSVSSNVPVAAMSAGALSGKTIKDISFGTNHTCAIASDNLVYCWGFNGSGQLGNNSTTTTLTPTAVSTTGVLSGKTIKKVSAGNSFTCVVASDDMGYCWGSGTNNRLGRSSTSNSLVPIALTSTGMLSGKTLKDIAAGDLYGCALASDSQVYCWGSNASGQLGVNSSAIMGALTPGNVYTGGDLSGKTVKSLMAGQSHVCVIASDDKGYCWGGNTSQQVGSYASPTYAPTVLYSHTTSPLATITLKKIGTSKGSFSCALASDANTYCWGSNTNGQLGYGTTGSMSATARLVTVPTP